MRRLAAQALAGTAIAALATLILLLFATASGQVLQVQVGTRASQQVTAGAIVSVVLACGVAAWGTAVLATRLAPRPRAAFLAAAVTVLALSLVPPATAATGAATWWLEAMHLVVFTALVGALAPAVPPRTLTDRVHLEAQAHGGTA
jgi:hypothetical protein